MTSMMNRTSRSHPGPTVTATTSTTSHSTVSAFFMQRPNVETETPEHKTLNNTLVTTNEVINRTCKYRVSHAPSHTSHRKQLRITGSFYLRDRNWKNQHTRKTLGTLSWVYKTSDYLMVIGPGSPCWSYQSQDLWPAKTVWRRGTPLPCHCRKRRTLDRTGYRCILQDKRNKLSGDQNPL